MLFDIQTDRETELSIPFDIKPKSILLNNDNLFIGGQMGKVGDVMFVQYHIKSKKWYQLEMPEDVKEASIFGKGVDDIVINDSLLIAIDNEITPKYILFYRLNSTEKLPLSHFKDLQSRPNEKIFQGRITPDYFGIRSKATALDGVSEYITIYKGLDLTKIFAISTSISLQEQNTHTYNDFLIIGNKVVIANKDNGLGTIEIKDSYFENNSDDFWYVLLTPISDSKVSYKAYPNENIIRLTQIPNTSKIVLTIENSSKKIRYEIVETGNKKSNSEEIPIKWVNNLIGDFSFKDKWSYPEGVEDDTTHIFHSIESEAWCYEWGGTDYITAQRINKDTVECFTECNAATHSSLNLIITKKTVKPTIVLNSISDFGTKAYNCKSGQMEIDETLWNQGILKATFDFDFYHSEDSTRMYWKGKIYAEIESE